MNSGVDVHLSIIKIIVIQHFQSLFLKTSLSSDGTSDDWDFANLKLMDTMNTET